MEEEEAYYAETKSTSLICSEIAGMKKRSDKRQEKEATIKIRGVKQKFTAAVNFVLGVSVFYGRGS